MVKRVTLTLADEAAGLLPLLAPSVKRQGEFVSQLIRASAASAGAPVGTDLESLRLQMLGLAGELHAIKARLLAPERRNAWAIVPATPPGRATGVIPGSSQSANR